MAHSQGTRQKPPQVFLCTRQKHPQGCLAPNKIEACAFFLLQTRQKPPQVCFGPEHDRSQRRFFLTTQRPMHGVFRSLCFFLRTPQRHMQGFPAPNGPKSVTLSVRSPLSPYGIAYRRGYGLVEPELFKKSLESPLCDRPGS